MFLLAIDYRRVWRCQVKLQLASKAATAELERLRVQGNGSTGRDAKTSLVRLEGILG